MKKFIEKYVDHIIPIYAILPLIFGMFFNSFVYFGGQQISKGFYHHNLSNSIDRDIPFINSFVVIYCFWYIFYLFNYILITREGKDKYFKFFTADFIAKIICFFLFVFFPTTMDLRPAVTEHSIFDSIIKVIYFIDPPTNLFPSIHCMVSWFCFIGIKNSNKIPYWYKLLSLVISLLIIISTLLVKQHIVIDAIAGVLLAEITYLIGQKTTSYKIPMKIFDKITDKLFY